MTKFSELATTSLLGDADLVAVTQGGVSKAITGQSLKSAIPVDLAGQKAAVSFFEPAPAAGDVTLVYRIPVAARLDDVDFNIASGSLDIAVKKNGTALSGLTAIGVAATGTAAAAGAANDNDFAAGDKLSITLSAPNAAARLEMSFNFTRL
jgi:hypothetical protein